LAFGAVLKIRLRTIGEGIIARGHQKRLGVQEGLYTTLEETTAGGLGFTESPLGGLEGP